MSDRTRDFEDLEQAFANDPASFKAYESVSRTVGGLIQLTEWASHADFRSACATPRLGHGLLLQAAELTKEPEIYRLRALELCKKAMRNLPDRGFRYPWWQDAFHYVSLIGLCQWQALDLLTSRFVPAAEAIDLHVLAKLLAKIRLHGFRHDHLPAVEWSIIDPTGLLQNILHLGHRGVFDLSAEIERALARINDEGETPLGQWFEYVLNRAEGQEAPLIHHTFVAVANSLGAPGLDSQEDSDDFRSIIFSMMLECVISTSPTIYSVLLDLAERINTDDEELDHEDDQDDDCDDQPTFSNLADVREFARANGIDVDIIIDEIRATVDLQCGCATCTANRRILIEADADASVTRKPDSTKARAKSGSTKPSGRIWRPSS